MPIASIRLENFKVFRSATLPLGRTTLIIGPNGSGKSTCLSALELLATIGNPRPLPSANQFRSIGVDPSAEVKIEVEWTDPEGESIIVFPAAANVRRNQHLGDLDRTSRLSRTRIFSFQPERIAEAVPLASTLEMQSNGVGLATVLTTLQDGFPERFEELNTNLARWVPEFDRVLLETRDRNLRGFLLRTKIGQHRVPAGRLSQGTLLSMALLTLCHLPDPPTIIGIEEPDRGIHPRLLRDVLDAVHRLSHPEDFGDNRAPVQVVMTTHSPYFVDLFKDRLQDIIIAEKVGLWSTLRRLADIPHVDEIIRDSQLGESWFNGVLGGIPAHT